MKIAKNFLFAFDGQIYNEHKLTEAKKAKVRLKMLFTQDNLFDLLRRKLVKYEIIKLGDKDKVKCLFNSCGEDVQLTLDKSEFDDIIHND